MLKMICTLATFWIFDRLDRLLDLLDAYPVVPDKFFVLQPVKRIKNGWLIIQIGRRAVQLNEVEDVDLEVIATSLDPFPEVFEGVAGRRLSRQTFSGLGRDVRTGAAAAAEGLGNQFLRAPVAIDVCGVNESNTEIERSR